MFKIKPLKEVLAMSKEKLEEAMIPLRVRSNKAKAEMLKVTLEEQMVNLETQITSKLAQKEIDFNSVADSIDEYELAERRLKQVNNILEQLFPAE